jgi:Na+-transporting methylmalonyl-CoA/oxaloacetate decarboxylase gamma subunit
VGILDIFDAVAMDCISQTLVSLTPVERSEYETGFRLEAAQSLSSFHHVKRIIAPAEHHSHFFPSLQRLTPSTQAKLSYVLVLISVPALF